MFALFCVPWAANAQTMTIGTGTSAHNSAPIANYYNYSLAEMLFTSAEIGTTDANTILSIGFEGAAASTKTYSITVYMKNVDATGFTANTDYIQVSADDIVYTGPIKPEVGWNTIELANPFAYDNTKSLLVVVNKTSGGYSGNTSIWKYTSTSSPYMMLYAQNDGSSYNPTTLTSLATSAERPNVQLTFGTPPSCTAPTSVTATLDGNITWEGEGTTWNLNYKASSASTWTEVNGITSMSYTIPNLANLTTYSVRVQNVCDDNSTTAWTYADDFTTPAGIPLVEPFNTSSIPNGWTKYTGLLDDVMAGTLAPATTTSGWSFGTGNGVFDSHVRVNIYGNSCNRWLVLPTLVMEDNVQLTFDIALTKFSGDLQAIDNTLGEDDRFVVLITTDGGTTWSILREWNNTGSDYVYNNIACSAIGESVAINLSDYAGQSIAVAFYGESTVEETGSDNNLHIDNVSIDYIPDCAKPTGLAKSDVTAHEATITWTSDAAAWQVQLNEENPIDVTEATYTFTGLDSETAYTATVRANCSGTYSDWANPVSFTTTIACPAPTNLTVTPNAQTATFTWESNAGEWEVAYATDADADPAENIAGTANDATYTVRDLELGDYYFWVRANCGELDGNSTWAGPASVHIGYCVPNPSSRDGKGITSVVFGTGDYLVNNVDETNGLPASSPYYGDYSSMVGAMQAGVESTVSITYATGSGTVYSYGTIIWVDWDNSMSFEDSEIVYTGTSNQGTGGVPQMLDATFIVPVNQATGEYRMRIAGADSYFDSYIGGTATANHSACFSNSYSVCHDYTLRVLEAPSCLTPTGLTASDETAHEATIIWTSDATAWQVQLNEEDPIDVEEATYTFENLAPETTYTAKVRANCNGTYSEWTNLVSFTTTVACPAPTNVAVNGNLFAVITWEGVADDFRIAYSTDNTVDPEENIIATVVVNPELGGENTYSLYNDPNVNLAEGDHYVWVRCTCDGEGNSAWTGPVAFHVGYCTPNPTSHDGSGITGVSFGMGDYVVENGGEDTSIPATSPYYGDYTDMIGAVQAGVESTIAITTATGSYPYTFVIWVDFNGNMDFEDSEIVYIGKASSGAGTHNATITVPATQATGDYRMRIYGADSYFNSFYGNGTTNWQADHDPCSSGTYRHANDYTLRVLEAPSCLTPTGLAVNYTGGNTAEVTWEGEAETYNLYVNQEVYNNITSPYPLESLELATTYTLQVEANCDDETSELSNPVSFTTDLCLPENMCEISYSFTDQYNDSWNSAYMNIVDATTEEVLYELTMPGVQGPYEGSFNVCDGRDIQFVWVSGSYPRECGYTFTHNGETILEKATNSAAPAAGVVLTYTVNCSEPVACTITLDENNEWSENFDNLDIESTERLTGTTMGDCWTWTRLVELPTGYVDTVPQIYNRSAFAHSGDYSLLLWHRGVYAMPVLDSTININELKMSFYVRQSYSFYTLLVGVMTNPNDPETFEPIAHVDNGTSTAVEYIELDFANYQGEGRYIAFKNVRPTATEFDGDWNDIHSVNYIDDIKLSLREEGDCVTGLPYEQNFDGVTLSTNALTGAMPECWEMVQNDLDEEIPFDKMPQVYCKSSFANSGNYSLRMVNRCIYAMPLLADTIDMSKVQLSMSVRQPNARYQLYVGVWSDGEFYPVALVDNATTGYEDFSCDFSKYDGPAGRIAFRNVLSKGKAFDYSYNYIDDIVVFLGETPVCDAVTSLNVTESFEDYTQSTVAATGVMPTCWEVVEKDVEMAFDKYPQVYNNPNFAGTGDYSLVMIDRCVIAMPELEDGIELNDVTLTMKLRQPNTQYQLEVGVWEVGYDENQEPIEQFVPVATLHNADNTVTEVSCDFASYTGNGTRIAFRNTLKSGNYNYSYNYLDDITLTLTEAKIAASSSANVIDEMDVENYLENIVVYPNPTKDVINVQCTMYNVQCPVIEIVDVYGKIITTVGTRFIASSQSPASAQSPTQINVSGLAAGMYFVRVTTDRGVVTKPFVKR